MRVCAALAKVDKAALSDTGSPRYAEIARFFDDFASQEDAWLERTGGYHVLVRGIYRSLVPAGCTVLEIGSGRGDLLAALQPRRGLGVDVSPGMVAAARERHPELEFECMSGEDLRLEETFDYVVLSDVIPYVDDLQALFANVARHCHLRSRVVISSYSNGWRPLLSLLSRLRLRPRRPVCNWVAPRDAANLAELAGLEVVIERKEMLAPTRSRPLSAVANGILARLPALRHLSLAYWLVARPAATPTGDRIVSVVVPCRNEAGSIDAAVRRIPEMGAGTEIVFVEGGSSDDTRQRIEAAMAGAGRPMRLVAQTRTGKWNAVQDGFAAASGDVLMILDGDLTVAPEDLPKFYEALASGRAELAVGSRLVYGMETGAMRFLNMLGNKGFAALLSFILGQYVKDTLCGTKALHRDDWQRIRAQSHEIAPEDPFGDFELLLGGALLGLKIVNVPVRYRARVYGATNIRRFPHGGMLARLAAAGYRRIWLRPVTDP